MSTPAISTCVNVNSHLDGVRNLYKLMIIRNLLLTNPLDPTKLQEAIKLLWVYSDKNANSYHSAFVNDIIEVIEMHIVSKSVAVFLTNDFIDICKLLLGFLRTEQDIQKMDKYVKNVVHNDTFPQLALLSKAYAYTTFLCHWIKHTNDSTEDKKSGLATYLASYRIWVAKRLNASISVASTVLDFEGRLFTSDMNFGSIYQGIQRTDDSLAIMGIYTSSVNKFFTNSDFTTLVQLIKNVWVNSQDVSEDIKRILTQCYNEHLRQPIGTSPPLPFNVPRNEQEQSHQCIYAAAFLVYNSNNYPILSSDTKIHGFVFLLAKLLTESSNDQQLMSIPAIRSNIAVLMGPYLDTIHHHPATVNSVDPFDDVSEFASALSENVDDGINTRKIDSLDEMPDKSTQTIQEELTVFQAFSNSAKNNMVQMSEILSSSAIPTIVQVLEITTLPSTQTSNVQENKQSDQSRKGPSLKDVLQKIVDMYRDAENRKIVLGPADIQKKKAQNLAVKFKNLDFFNKVENWEKDALYHNIQNYATNYSGWEDRFKLDALIKEDFKMDKEKSEFEKAIEISKIALTVVDYFKDNSKKKEHIEELEKVKREILAVSIIILEVLQAQVAAMSSALTTAEGEVSSTAVADKSAAEDKLKDRKAKIQADFKQSVSPIFALEHWEPLKDGKIGVGHIVKYIEKIESSDFSVLNTAPSKISDKLSDLITELVKLYKSPPQLSDVKRNLTKEHNFLDSSIDLPQIKKLIRRLTRNFYLLKVGKQFYDLSGSTTTKWPKVSKATDFLFLNQAITKFIKSIVNDNQYKIYIDGASKQAVQYMIKNLKVVIDTTNIAVEYYNLNDQVQQAYKHSNSLMVAAASVIGSIGSLNIESTTILQGLKTIKESALKRYATYAFLAHKDMNLLKNEVGPTMQKRLAEIAHHKVNNTGLPAAIVQEMPQVQNVVKEILNILNMPTSSSGLLEKKFDMNPYTEFDILDVVGACVAAKAAYNNSDESTIASELKTWYNEAFLQIVDNVISMASGVEAIDYNKTYKQFITKLKIKINDDLERDLGTIKPGNPRDFDFTYTNMFDKKGHTTLGHAMVAFVLMTMYNEMPSVLLESSGISDGPQYIEYVTTSAIKFSSSYTYAVKQYVKDSWNSGVGGPTNNKNSDSTTS